MRGAKRVKWYWHRLRRHFVPGAVILMYHRVSQLSSDPYQIAVTPEHFAEHISHIARTCTPLRLTELVGMLQRGQSLPKRAIAITFDDGYVDNYSTAYPLLKAEHLTATVFVATQLVDADREFWWDDLERLLRPSSSAPDWLRIRINGHEREWPTGTPEQRQHARRELHQAIRVLSSPDRDHILEELADWSGMTRGARAGYRAVATSELVELARSNVLEIGGHTSTHPRLSSLTADQQRMEIVGGRKMLESVIGASVTVFAYPYGGEEDFTAGTAAIVREAGFRAACTTVHGAVEFSSDVYRLRRCAVFDWPAQIFERRLDHFFVD